MSSTKAVFITFVVAFLTVLAYRSGGRLLSEKFQDKKISEICDVITLEVQTGSYNRAIESANTQFSRVFPDVPVVVQIKEKQTFFGEDVASSNTQKFRGTTCAIPARSDVSLLFFTERRPIFDQFFLPVVGITAIAIWIFALGLIFATRKLVGRAQKIFNLEIQKSLGLMSELPSKSPIGRWLDYVIQGGGTGDNLKKSVHTLKSKIEEQRQEFAKLHEVQVLTELDLKKNEKFVEVVRQVRHDIRGPLQTLLLMMEEKSEKRFETRRIGAIVSSIQGMIEDLEMKEQMADQSRSGEVLHVAEALVKEVIQQKRVLFGSTNIEFKIGSEFLSVVRIQPLHFKRLISNILQNAFEAMEETGGVIRVSTAQRDGQLHLSIQDSGCGIPDHIKAGLFTSGFTHGKIKGSGLGLSHAKSCILKWSGDIQIDSKEKNGTTVTISLPIALPAAHFVAKSPLTNAAVNVIVDDELESFHRIQAILPGPSVYCSSLQEFDNWRTALGTDNDAQFIFDYNLNESTTGLEFLQDIASPYPRVLATNDYERPDVIAASCKGIYVLPKIFLTEALA